MLFADPADYDRIGQEDVLEIEHFRAQIAARRVTVRDKTRGFAFEAVLDLTDSEVQVVLCHRAAALSEAAACKGNNGKLTGPKTLLRRTPRKAYAAISNKKKQPEREAGKA